MCAPEAVHQPGQYPVRRQRRRQHLIRFRHPLTPAEHPTTAPADCLSPDNDADLSGVLPAAPARVRPAGDLHPVSPHRRAPATVTRCGCKPSSPGNRCSKYRLLPPLSLSISVLSRSCKRISAGIFSSRGRGSPPARAFLSGNCCRCGRGMNGSGAGQGDVGFTGKDLCTEQRIDRMAGRHHPAGAHRTGHAGGGTV